MVRCLQIFTWKRPFSPVWLLASVKPMIKDPDAPSQCKYAELDCTNLYMCSVRVCMYGNAWMDVQYTFSFHLINAHTSDSCWLRVSMKCRYTKGHFAFCERVSEWGTGEKTSLPALFLGCKCIERMKGRNIPKESIKWTCTINTYHLVLNFSSAYERFHSHQI